MTTDWIIAIGTIIAAVAAVAAALFTKQSAREAARAATAAAEQVDLSRPRPLVVATFGSYWGSLGRTPNDASFTLENIGDSPAFDVDVSPIRTPGVVLSIGRPSVSTAEPIRYLLPRLTLSCTHKLEGEGHGVLQVLSPMNTFLDHAKEYFYHVRDVEAGRNRAYQYEIGFTLSYSALDRRRLVQQYVFVVHLTRQLAWVEPVGSLLESSNITS